VRILLDTQVWLWMAAAPARLSRHTRRVVEDTSHTLYLSSASAWEIAIKHGLGKLRLPEPPETYVPSRIAALGVLPLPIDHAHALRVTALPAHHRDPFDRLLVAQSQLEGLPILTTDDVLARYGVEILDA
jgi:PIN domain nuclease of toxin-antitoxin system